MQRQPINPRMSPQPKFRVTRLFIGGILGGLTHTEITTVRFEVGWECLKPIGRSPYRIIECSPVN